MPYVGNVFTGPNGGHVAAVSNGDIAYEIHPMGLSKHREFYSRAAAEGLANGHAAHINRDGLAVINSSWVRVA